MAAMISRYAMNMKYPVVFALIFSLFAGHRPAAFGSPLLEVTLDATTKRQGEFFVVTVSATSSRPELRFDGRSYTMFLQENSSYRALVPLENLMTPGSYEVLLREGALEQKISVEVMPNNLPVQEIRLDKKTAGLKATEEEITQVKQALGTLSELRMWSGRFSYPCNGRKSSPFGVRRSYNGAPVSSYHKGIDIAVPEGTPVLSPADGEVVLTGYEAGRFHLHGNTVVIDHGQGLLTIYLHMKTITVRKGAMLKKGDPIGTVGSTGISTGPHLHWGASLYGISVDPELFVRQEY